MPSPVTPQQPFRQRLFLGLSRAYGRHMPVYFRKWQICMKLLSAGGINPWQHPGAWQTFAQALPSQDLTTVDGHVFQSDLSDSTYLGLYFMRCHEPGMRKFFKRHVKPGAVVADVGTNIGMHTLYLASLATPSGHVHAFEPVPSTAAKAQKHIEHNRHHPLAPITFNNFALGQQDATLEIKVVQGISGQSIDSGYSTLKDHIPENRTYQTVPVPVHRFDDYAKQHDLQRLDLIKCDIEGAEYDFFLGARDTIERLRPVLVFEWNPGPGTYDGNTFLEALLQLGYRATPLRSIIRSLIPGRPDYTVHQGDVAFLPSG